MKIRTGFVSNSSSSSFCIYGIEINEIDFMKLLKDDQIKELINEFKEKYNYGDNDYFLNSWLTEKAWGEFKGLEVYNNSEGEVCYIGRSWKNIGDKETGEDFKNNVEKNIKKYFDNNVEIQTYDEIIYN